MLIPNRSCFVPVSPPPFREPEFPPFGVFSFKKCEAKRRNEGSRSLTAERIKSARSTRMFPLSSCLHTIESQKTHSRNVLTAMPPPLLPFFPLPLSHSFGKAARQQQLKGDAPITIHFYSFLFSSVSDRSRNCLLL